MRFLKLGLISIVFFSLLLTGISLLLPSSVNISRTIDINADARTVYANLNDMANWKKWYAGYDSTNAVVTVNSIGKGASLTTQKTTITIKSATPNQITTTWKTGNSDTLPAVFNIIVQNNASLVTLQWQFMHTVKWYPWEKFALIVSNKSIGPFMEKSLENLKKRAEETTGENL